MLSVHAPTHAQPHTTGTGTAPATGPLDPRHRAELEQGSTILPTARDLWQHLYGDGPGFLCTFAAVRATPGTQDLDGERQQFFAWPAEADKAAEWIEREATQGREVYQ